MRQYKAVKAGTLSNPYVRVRKDQVLSLKEEQAAGVRWLVPVEEYVEDYNEVVVPHMKVGGVRPMQTNFSPPASSSKQYDESMANIRAKEAVEDGKAANMAEAKEKASKSADVKPGEFKEVKPGTFVGEAVVQTKKKPGPKKGSNKNSAKNKGTGSQEVL